MPRVVFITAESDEARKSATVAIPGTLAPIFKEMNRTLLFLITLLVLSCNQKTTDDREKIVSIIETENKEIKNVQNEHVTFDKNLIFGKKADPDLIEIFLKNRIDDFPQFFGMVGYNLDSLKNSLFTVDINGDNIPDIIFSGISGGEPNLVKLYINHRDSFSLIFKDYQYLTEMNFETNRLKSFKIIDPGCCGEYLIFEKIYNLTYRENYIDIQQISQTVKYEFLENFTERLLKPIRFKVINEKYYLRSSGEILNEPHKSFLETNGNIMGILRKDDKGTAIGKKIDETGREWWYVKLDSDVKPDSSIFYGLDEFPTNIYGWISSRFVEEIEE